VQELKPEDFPPSALPQALGDNEIHLWFFPQWEESTRAAAESPGVRTLLAAHLDCTPCDLRIARDEHGKPHLDGPQRLEFNLSHSAGALLVGVSRRQPLGVDLEMPRRTRPVLDLARRYFDPAEVAALASVPEAMRQTAFLRLWSCKEAVLKALGRGIAFGLHRIVFALDGAGSVTTLQHIDGKPAEAWHVVRLCPLGDAIGAVAWSGPECIVRAFRKSPSLP
jgi:4'-phosphopantetheinyl transferase